MADYCNEEGIMIDQCQIFSTRLKEVLIGVRGDWWVKYAALVDKYDKILPNQIGGYQGTTQFGQRLKEIYSRVPHVPGPRAPSTGPALAISHNIPPAAVTPKMKGKEFNAEDAAEILRKYQRDVLKLPDLPDPCDKSYGKLTSAMSHSDCTFEQGVPSWLHSCRGDSQAPRVGEAPPSSGNKIQIWSPDAPRRPEVVEENTAIGGKTPEVAG